MATIRVETVSKSFGGVDALRSVSLEVRDREFAVLLGPSGCGKTTLLRIIAGLETETSGALWIGDRQVNGLPPRARRIAMVFQNYAVFPHMTVFDNIAFGLRMKKVPEGEVDRKVQRAAGMMHIERLLDRYSAQLSGGQRQRVAVARALAVESQVLLMDEPLSNLDALLRLEMRTELKRLLQESATTTIYVTHDQVEAMSLADRIAVMQGGVIVQYDRPMAVYQRPASRFVGGFIGNPPMNFLTVTVDPNGGRPGARLGGGRMAAPPGVAGAATLGIRPEDLDVVGTPSDDVLTGMVQVVEPLGPHQQLSIDVEGQALRVTVPADLDVHAGAQLHLRPKPGRLRWFDATSGAAIG